MPTSSSRSSRRSESKYGDDRRTEIIADLGEISIEDLIAEEDMVITVSRDGYIKRSAVSTYRAQRRGGRGRRGMATKAEDEVWKLFVASTHATMLFFTSTGRVFVRKVHELPDIGPAARGRALVNLLQLDDGRDGSRRCSRSAISPSTRIPSSSSRPARAG